MKAPRTAKAAARPRKKRSFTFGVHDRLVIGGSTYWRWRGKTGDRHLLQLVVGFVVEEHFDSFTDDQVGEMLDGPKPRMRVDEDWWGPGRNVLVHREDAPDSLPLKGRRLLDMLWRVEWLKAWDVQYLHPDGRRYPNTKEGRTAFIEAKHKEMDLWFLAEHGERRRPGRIFKGKVRKEYDYPSQSTLYSWLVRRRARNESLTALADDYPNCGNREQIHPAVIEEIEAAISKFYIQPEAPTKDDLRENVETRLEKLNATLPGPRKLVAGRDAINTRLALRDRFEVDAGRKGPQHAILAYAIHGPGLQIETPMERIEIDDWEIDLFALITTSATWRSLPREARRRVPRIRCTVTVAIDVATRCVVGLSVYPGPPSTATAKTALRSTLVDKSELAAFVGCISDWAMYGRSGGVATDGGPVFKGEFARAVERSRLPRKRPETSPRKRGTIEAFFIVLKRFCRRFAGRAFANVVERGEYPAEANASLTVELLYRLLIRYVVDIYHNTAKKGLEGGTPHGAWQRLAVDMAPTLSPMQLKLAFGHPRTGQIQKSGIEFAGHHYYKSEHLGAIFRAIGNASVTFVVDQLDMSEILLLIPERLRGREDLPPDTDYIVVGTDGVSPGTTLTDILMSKREVKEFVAKEVAEGREIRLAAVRDLFEAGLEAKRRANIPQFEVAGKQMKLLLKVVQRNELVAMERPRRGTKVGPVDERSFGTVVSSTPDARSPAEADVPPKFSGSINRRPRSEDGE